MDERAYQNHAFNLDVPVEVADAILAEYRKMGAVLKTPDDKIIKAAAVAVSLKAGQFPGRQEGSVCRRDGCIGRLQFETVENCSCHTNPPPCVACTRVVLECRECGWSERDDG